MAFAIRNLSVLAYAQGFTLWHYKGGAATLEQAGAHGFFDDASDGGRILFVAANADGVATATLE